jgi:dTDP-4-amino-4,6-dideoxygalactose transaminase
LPVAERLAGEVLSLPIGPQMTDEEMIRVINAVKAFSPDWRKHA